MRVLLARTVRMDVAWHLQHRPRPEVLPRPGDASLQQGRHPGIQRPPGDARLRDEVRAGLATVQREGFGGSHCLCHGDVGNLEVLHLAGEVLGEEAWKQAARSRAARVLAQGRDGAWRCGLPRFTEAPGLMLGLSGIGLGLLRLAAPDFVPSVLALQPARSLGSG
ncbi:lanthionine synthetase LanC family protein [Corallococcus carmarthensis]|uniref:lanthionine synthetase LanC family protein n=1 Tax=Corallococcus carmarthensis TaxID=2316728 RepID=UPI0020A4607B|nr:lanthionine synthetase LanC family protein [Corallococcus carmarthensis]